MAKFKSTPKAGSPAKKKTAAGSARKTAAKPGKTSAKAGTPPRAAHNPVAQAIDLGTRTLVDSAQQIWQTGVSALDRAQAEGTRLFETLVKEGMQVEQQTRTLAKGKVDHVRDSVENRVDQVKGRAADTWDRLEKVFEQRVQRALVRLGVPGHDELQELIARVDELNVRLQALAPDSAPAPAKKAATSKAPAKKAATSKAPAKKAVTSKAPAKKAATSKAPAKKAATSKAPAKKAATSKAPAKKAATNKAPAKKAATSRAPAKKAAASKAPAKKAATSKAPAKKAAAAASQPVVVTNVTSSLGTVTKAPELPTKDG